MSAINASVIDIVPVERAERRRRRANSTCPHLFELLDAVKDPELPALSLWELGVLQNVEAKDGGVHVVMTPTYSGCPALAHMETEVRETLSSAGYSPVTVEICLAPAWSSDWLEPAAQEKLRAYGIAPPSSLACPQCASEQIELVSEFGSTACKALYRCVECLEPFDHFKKV